MLAILNKEFKSYFRSPVAYVFMAFFFILFGIYFSIICLGMGASDYSYVLGSVSIALIIGIPIITMRLLTEETKLKTDQLILTSPVSVTDYVLGKYLAALALFAITIGITILQPISLGFFGALPVAKIIGSYIGYLFLGATFISIGLFVSSLTENQVVSALVTFAALIVVLLMDGIIQVLPKDRRSAIIFALLLIVVLAILFYNAINNIYISAIVGVIGFIIIGTLYFVNPLIFDGFTTKFFGWFSLMKRYDAFSKGIFDLSGVIYYISFSVLFVFLTIRKIEKKRWS